MDCPRTKFLLLCRIIYVILCCMCICLGHIIDTITRALGGKCIVGYSACLDYSTILYQWSLSLAYENSWRFDKGLETFYPVLQTFSFFWNQCRARHATCAWKGFFGVLYCVSLCLFLTFIDATDLGFELQLISFLYRQPNNKAFVYRNAYLLTYFCKSIIGFDVTPSVSCSFLPSKEGSEKRQCHANSPRQSSLFFLVGWLRIVSVLIPFFRKCLFDCQRLDGIREDEK